MMRPVPEERPTIEEILLHPFFQTINAKDGARRTLSDAKLLQLPEQIGAGRKIIISPTTVAKEMAAEEEPIISMYEGGPSTDQSPFEFAGFGGPQN